MKKNVFNRITPLTLAIILGIGIGFFFIQGRVNVEEKEIDITLLATSDIHGRFMPWDYASDEPNLEGSLTQLQTLIKEVREENPHTILLDAGDTIQDNYAEVFNDQSLSPLMVAMNEMGYDAWALGNHEFNFGLDELKKITSQYKGPKLAGNSYKENGERFLPAYTIIEREGIKIGIIGMVTPMVTEYEKDTDHLDGVVIKNVIEETKKAVAELDGKVDAIIGLVHMGLENELGVPETGVKDIANAVPELDAVFAGHDHVLIEKEEVNGVLVTEPNRYGTHLSRIDLTFQHQGDHWVLQAKDATVIPVVAADGSIAESDKELETLLKPYHDIARAESNKVIAELKGTDLVPKDVIKGIPTVQIQETPLTDFLHEVMLYYSEADVVAHQIDNDQASLDRGPIRKKDIGYNYQFADGDVSVYRVTGKELKEYMEWAAGYFNTARSGDVTISFDKSRRSAEEGTNDIFGNVKYEIDLREQPGHRIKHLRKLDGTPIKSDDQLTLGMNSDRMEFLRSKGELFEGKKFKKIWASQDESAYGATEGSIRNLAIHYLQEVQKGEYKPDLQTNWRIVGIDTESAAYSAVVYLANKGIIEIPSTKDGKGTNIESINVTDPISKPMVKKLALKANVSEEPFSEVKTTGDFYQKLAQVLKESESVKK